MKNEDMQAIFDRLNNNEELKQKYREATTSEEKSALFSEVSGLQANSAQKLEEAELETVNGGSQQHIRCMAVCSTCGWRSRIVNKPETAYNLGIEHIDSTRCYSFQIAGV